MLADAEIRAHLCKSLSTRDSSAAPDKLVHELPVLDWRVDLALIGAAWHGWEIKSDVDSVSRLEGQSAAFGKVFDFMTLAVGEKLVKRAMGIVPTWWGVTVFREASGEVTQEVVRQSSGNPACDPMALALMLWKPELVSLALKTMGWGPQKFSRAELATELALHIPLARLRPEVTDVILARTDWKSDGGRTSTEFKKKFERRERPSLEERQARVEAFLESSEPAKVDQTDLGFLAE